jgi:predicted nucleic acid-binding protein
VDASLVIKWLVPEEGSEEALQLFRAWKKKETPLLAPSLIDYEVGTALRQKIVRGLLQSDDLFPIIDLYQRLGLHLHHLEGFVSKAVAVAATLHQPTIYDVSYLLLAKEQGAEFVTADERFCKSASLIFPFVKFYKHL